MGRVFDRVYKEVQKVPYGKVTTYRSLAGRINIKISKQGIKSISPRVVGWALHQNLNPKKIPCHRVVNKDGLLAKGYRYGGREGQRRRLLSEGITFKEKYQVILDNNQELC